MTSIIDLSREQHVGSQISPDLLSQVELGVDRRLIGPYLLKVEEDARGLLLELWSGVQGVQLMLDKIDPAALDARDQDEFMALSRVNAGFAHFIMLCEMYREDQTPVDPIVLASFAFQITCHVDESLTALRMVERSQGALSAKTVRIN